MGCYSGAELFGESRVLMLVCCECRLREAGSAVKRQPGSVDCVRRAPPATQYSCPSARYRAWDRGSGGAFDLTVARGVSR